jgi:hypothetical protein
MGPSMVRLLLVPLMLCGAFGAVAQQIRVPIKVLHTGDDPVGKLFSYELREMARGANGVRLVEDDAYLEPHVRISLVTIDPDGNQSSKGAWTAMAIVLSYDSVSTDLRGLLMTAQIQLCGKTAVQSCARAVMASIDEEIRALQKEKLQLWRNLQHRK